MVGADGTPYASYIDACTPDPEEACPIGVGVVGRLIGGPPLWGTIADQQPTVAPAPPAPPPAAPACAARRFTVRVRKPRRGRLTRVSMTANGRRLKVRRNRAVLRIPAGAPRTVVVRIRTRTSTGRRQTLTRRYRNCR